MARVNLEAMKSRYGQFGGLLSDCIQIRSIMEDGWRQPLADLESALDTYIQNEGSMKKALTRTLQQAESYCGINPSAPIYMRFLSAEEFGTYGGQGMMFKDIGAGYEHGEYTHRIQWYTILHTMSAGFTQNIKGSAPKGWSNTPKQLIIKINTTPIQMKSTDWPAGEEGNQGFWDALFDRGPGWHPGFDPSTDGIANPETFSGQLFDKAWLKQQDNNRHLALKNFYSKYQGLYASLSTTYPNLSRIVTKRYLKRLTQDWAGNRQAYFKKKLEQTTGTLYQQSPVSLNGVLEMRIVSEQKKRACFLTTACTAARGLPDDCFELRVLRNFRDDYLMRQARGPQLVAEYYEIAPELVARIARHPRADAILSGIYATVCRAVKQILRQDNEAALRTYTAMVRELGRCL